MPTFQIEMQALPTLNFRYFTCLFDKGHIKLDMTPPQHKILGESSTKRSKKLIAHTKVIIDDILLIIKNNEVMIFTTESIKLCMK